ncbi:prepilin peptidase [Tepidibacillus marianensis]|uniref:prepilin peptidase n=1 Tax=Tepidibacillus marianensis TaxID=3131995 RepID=UPI0030CB0952
MNLVFWSTYILLSLFIGSFLNVVAIRIPKKESIVFPPSHCPTCNHKLSALDLFPIFSYLGLRGKCRYCGAKISPIYPFGEFLTLIIFLLIPYFFGFSKELYIAFPFAMVMIAVTLSDIRYHIIPDKITYPAILLFILLRLWIHPLPIWNYFFAAFLIFAILILLNVISEKVFQKVGMGGGDLKLFFLIGLVLGWQNTLLALFLSSAVGSIIGILLIAFRVIQRRQMIPYGPFIFVGTMLAYFLGNQIWGWYLGLY